MILEVTFTPEETDWLPRNLQVSLYLGAEHERKYKQGEPKTIKINLSTLVENLVESLEEEHDISFEQYKHRITLDSGIEIC